ncbi:2-C-methyl-D-erythritol 4-phosphate cytidylyltransferase [Arcticibacter tournemirensis]|uniref:2-C-methyl-D-erythritol 4-phosphate cytidylyltransferase n=1 Tax=Arcticibacter tournemirensis TaxID=699437 RepID=A0A4Q0MGU6_9SPHI|nr:2-C-methyl-D-erythritol 4-phosphate cytidylyltransferase [Arcticibacter tournemirensis]RXF72493.1 2-C-methyl-D-erythritol 4-phosphate cytidylyltransferase [Arcticibacter tournemirensis]
MKFYAIIVAGGSGSRMNSEIPKQFIPLLGKPVLMHTIEAFYYSDLKPRILLVLNHNFHSFWDELCRKYDFSVPHKVIEGGTERFYSVKNALDTIHDESAIAIHDAVRPVIDNELITRCFSEALIHKAVVPVIESRDSLRKKNKETTSAIAREDILIVQTPQVFESSLLKRAYEQNYSKDFTDDASVVEKAGGKIHITSGDFKNIKVTYPEDLEVASLFLKIQAQKKSGL